MITLTKLARLKRKDMRRRSNGNTWTFEFRPWVIALAPRVAKLGRRLGTDDVGVDVGVDVGECPGAAIGSGEGASAGGGGCVGVGAIGESINLGILATVGADATGAGKGAHSDV